MNREATIAEFIEGYAETSTGEENLTRDVGAIFDYIEELEKAAPKIVFEVEYSKCNIVGEDRNNGRVKSFTNPDVNFPVKVMVTEL